MALFLIAPKPFTVVFPSTGGNISLKNLNIDHPTMVWRSFGLTDDMTVQVNGTWDTVSLYGTNLRPTDTVRIRAAFSAAGTTDAPTYDSGNLPAFAEPASDVSNLFLFTLPVLSPRSEPFIRIDITSPGNPAGFIEASRLIVSKRVEEEGIDVGYEQGFEDASEITTYRGVANVTPYATHMSNKFSISALPDASYQRNWFPTLRDSGQRKAVLLIPDSTSTYIQNEAIFGLFANSAKGSAVSSDWWKLELYVRSL